MQGRVIVVALALLVAGAGSAGLKAGRPFPSPDAAQIVAGVTDKAALERIFGEPYQVGLDSGDQTWRWFYTEHGGDASKDFTVRFNANGTVKSYSFSSNFPEDMTRFRR